MSNASALGRQYKRINKANNVNAESYLEIDEPRYRRLNNVVLSLSPYSFLVINRHYIDRDNQPMREYLIDLQLDSKKYYKIMYEAVQEFIFKGGI